MIFKILGVTLLAFAVHALHVDYQPYLTTQSKEMVMVEFQNQFRKCLTNVFGYSSPDSVKKVCSNSNKQILKTCFNNLEASVRPYLDDVQSSLFNTYYIDIVIEYACYNHGEKLALFISTGGFECIAIQSDQLHNCFTETLGFLSERATKEEIGIEEICDMSDKMAACSVAALNRCSHSASGYIAEKFYSTLRMLSSCRQPEMSISGGVSTQPLYNNNVRRIYPGYEVESEDRSEHDADNLRRAEGEVHPQEQAY